MHQIKTICVCGAGTLGRGIAQICAQSGFKTSLFDLDKAVLDHASYLIQKSWESLVSKNKITEAAKNFFESNLCFSNNINECKADLIIEAIIEKVSAKINLFQQLSDINSINSLFVSNTSSISINLIASKLKEPFRFAGMHFFNPATQMKLVELVKGNETSDSMIKILQEVVVRMDKIAVVCKDSPGFIVNRVARHYYLESLILLEKGNIDFEKIDKVLEASGFKMGPFVLMDLIGIDINYQVSNIVWEALGRPKRLMPSSIQENKIEQKELGKKTGKGFYVYTQQ
jgi:3-hydroxybutyryl-CoA dehydrogenase